jgi:hypothetical protein
VVVHVCGVHVERGAVVVVCECKCRRGATRCECVGWVACGRRQCARAVAVAGGVCVVCVICM